MPYTPFSLPPALGPRIVFFTGGTALRALSQELTLHTHNSVHLVTPFDSGGSSAVLRREFHMAAVGDVRNRLVALADRELVPPAVMHIWDERLPPEGERDSLLQILYSLASERDPVWVDVPRVFGEVLRLHLRYFLDHLPLTFDPRLASVGNLLLVGGFLHHKRRLGPVLSFMSRLLQVRGTVLPIVNGNLHLAAELEDGTLLLGQHRITGRGEEALPAPVRRLFLTKQSPDFADSSTGTAGTAPAPCTAQLTTLAGTLLRAADAICYPMGSFYTSVMANLLPQGVGRAVAEAPCPKLYIPNSGEDPEQSGMSVSRAVFLLLESLRQDAGPVPAKQLLQKVLVDTCHGLYAGGVDMEGITAQGVEVVDMALVYPHDPQKHNPQLTAKALLAHCG